MNKYDQMAYSFLRRHNITWSTRFVEHGLHFGSDAENRDIFNVRFSRGKKRLVLRFGQSIANSDGRGSIPPTPYDVLASITKYPPGDFENFCADYGYDNDSISALNTYKLVSREWDKVSAFFTSSELEELAEIN